MQTDKASTAKTLTLTGRESISLSDVQEILRFDEEAVLCKTSLGLLTVEGEGLRVTSFSSADGTLTVKGTLCGLFYENEKGKSAKGGLFGRSR